MFNKCETSLVPEVLVEEIISYLPRCSKCKTVIWFSHTYNPMIYDVICVVNFFAILVYSM